jgi:hypothetical protein
VLDRMRPRIRSSIRSHKDRRKNYGTCCRLELVDKRDAALVIGADAKSLFLGVRLHIAD